MSREKPSKSSALEAVHKQTHRVLIVESPLLQRWKRLGKSYLRAGSYASDAQDVLPPQWWMRMIIEVMEQPAVMLVPERVPFLVLEFIPVVDLASDE